ncbi:hypothetical protein ANN_11242 [Periplaneta americana]|uniref:Endonuclease-reverse transcriptase n=1 Tax=Periplaneta americana TaxID=6978 RepID=A0ABQ8T4H4_PERAM|nr:hypothetical protein ANN_11242 [Periplaneta americana]
MNLDCSVSKATVLKIRRQARQNGKLRGKKLQVKTPPQEVTCSFVLPVVLYGCETWTLTLREKQRLRVFENKVLRKIFGAKRVEVTGEWRKLHNAELHALYSSPDIIRNIKSRRLRWAGHVVRIAWANPEMHIVLVGRPEGKRPLGRTRRRWEDNIKMDLREVGYVDREWINLAHDRDRWRAYVRAAMNLRVPPKSAGRPTASPASSPDSWVSDFVRYDRMDHLVQHTEEKKKRRCAQNTCKSIV